MCLPGTTRVFVCGCGRKQGHERENGAPGIGFIQNQVYLTNLIDVPDDHSTKQRVLEELVASLCIEHSYRKGN